MSRNLATGLAILLCLVVAGFGAYLAMRPAAPVVSAPEPGVSVSQDLVQTAVPPQAPAVTGTENVIAEPPAEAPAQEAGKSAPAAPATAKPAATPRTRGTSAGAASAPSPGAGTGAGAPVAPPAESPQNAGWSAPASTWPSGNAGSTPPAPPVATPPVAEPPTAPATPPPPPGPPPKTFEELVVSADSVLGIQLDSTVSSEVARVEDPVNAHVTRDVKVGSDIAVPAGTKVLGSVTQVERGGKMKEKARLSVRFHTLVMADGTRLPVSTDAILREGKSPGQESAAKMGAAAVGGAILGAIVGGGKGAAIGGSVGAAGGAAAVMAGGRNPAVLTAGTAVTVRLEKPVTVTIERIPQ